PVERIAGNSTIVTKASDTAPPASEIISNGFKILRPHSAFQWRNATPAASGSVMVEASTSKIVPTLNFSAPLPRRNFNPTSQIGGVRNAQKNGNSAVNAPASARSAFAIFANTGTTGANGAAASSNMPTEISVGT